IAIVLLITVPAEAGLPRSQLAAVAAEPPADARLDLSISAPDTDGRLRTIGGILAGRPGFLIFADYTCNTLCGTALELLAGSLAEAGIEPASYRIIVIGLDPKDSAQAADAMAERAIPAALRSAVVLLLPAQPTIDRATQALGFHYFYDSQNDQFAHPATVYLLAPNGAVRTMLSPFALTAVDIKQTLAAGMPAPSLYERVRLLCYGYDATSGVYTAGIGRLLRIFGAVAVGHLGSFVLRLVRIRNRVR
ncbi:MAG TPA: SCO family protein, partial [Pirellulales bacterium]|nr:SCO family protein [Pirellulales bacterium]